jgi:hypothetical protein
MALGGEVVKNEQAVQQTQLRISGAGDRDRTGMGGLSPRDFKSLASADFATPAAEGVQWRDCNIEV